jgi:hypothetical protein
MDWHRLFGLTLMDFFTGSPFIVELEKDLALKKQLLDVVVLRRGPGQFAGRLPDGLDNLAAHNLITFKSHHDALDDWTLKELTGHYVNYRKQCSARREPLLPEADFRLYAVCSRHPHNLANDVTLEPVHLGVYTCKRGTDEIRIIVAGQVSREPHNALLHLFSASAETVGYGAGHYEQRSHDTSSLVGHLLGNYRGEGITMSYTMADYRRDTAKEYFRELTPEDQRELLRGLTPEVLRGLTPEVLRSLTPEVLRSLTPEVLRSLTLEERFAGLSADEIAAYLKKLKSRRPSRKARPRRKP